MVLLERRILERFPDAGLSQVAGGLRRLVEESARPLPAHCSEKLALISKAAALDS
jgi:hypothetical protein